MYKLRATVARNQNILNIWAHCKFVLGYVEVLGLEGGES
jgi:hypothetical protein